ncbi:AAA family ATPase [Prosthecochloris sp.]|uniref:AAA family ATPase n=1 Tax=Prosthecochloris sp. TaxID=290513 RepID=UPI00257DF0B4|nr:AAA family ATPase [Prosthecochloris sp.]
MKQIKLLRLTLQNFKGLKDFIFEPNGESVTVAGQNGAGKTSLADALNWLFFDKDSQGKADFQIKPLKDGQEVHCLETKIEAIVEADGEPMSITKEYKEIWRKKRGSKDKEFDGHTTDYFIDDVPLKKSEFQQRIASICDEVTFRLLTSITYFNAMSWQDRRNIVLQVCGDVSMPDVIGKNPRLDGLPGILGKHGVEDFLKMTKSQRKEANKRIEHLPVRIDEAEKSKPELPGLTMGLDHLRKDLKVAQDRRAAMLAGDTLHLRDRIADLEQEKKAIQDRNEQAMRKDGEAKAALEYDRDKFLADIDANNRAIDDLDAETDRIEENLRALREEYRGISAEQWADDEEAGICPTCSQPLPEGMYIQARENFNQRKAERLKANRGRGQAKAALVKQIEDKKSGLTDKNAYLEQAVAERNRQLEHRPGIELESLALIISQIAEVQQKIDSAATPDTQEIDAEINRLQTNLEEAEQRKAALTQIKNIDKRIEELTAEQKDLAALIGLYDKRIYMCEEYTKARVSMLEGLVADKFEPYSFKMFEQQINGGISDTCELLRDGKPYSALSTGEKIAAGLHVIEVLSEHYGIACPVFIDNAESITLPVRSDLHQQIFLKAEDGVDVLTVKQDREEAA